MPFVRFYIVHSLVCNISISITTFYFLSRSPSVHVCVCVTRKFVMIVQHTILLSSIRMSPSNSHFANTATAAAAATATAAATTTIVVVVVAVAAIANAIVVAGRRGFHLIPIMVSLCQFIIVLFTLATYIRIRVLCVRERAVAISTNRLPSTMHTTHITRINHNATPQSPHPHNAPE